VNCDPLSDNISLGMPTRENTGSNASETEIESISFSGIASGNQVAKSIKVKM
jgi:hypothetical protein